MVKNWLVQAQRFLPQHLLSRFAGFCAEAKQPWFKNFLIRKFIQRYHIDLSSAEREQPEQYVSFNDFFTRKLKTTLRPICAEKQAIVSPVDGCVAMLGAIKKNQLLQAKDMYFDLQTLLGGDDELARPFYDGTFTTLYLAPHNYHRIHMPLDARLTRTTYIPGKLFSVNRMTSELIPQLYGRNERLVCVFDTAIGPMIMILVGAMIVGSMQTVCDQQPMTRDNTFTKQYDILLNKGEELGLFKLGSTVIMLFAGNKITWLPEFANGTLLQYGKKIGTF